MAKAAPIYYSYEQFQNKLNTAHLPHAHYQLIQKAFLFNAEAFGLTPKFGNGRRYLKVDQFHRLFAAADPLLQSELSQIEEQLTVYRRKPWRWWVMIPVN